MFAGKLLGTKTNKKNLACVIFKEADITGGVVADPFILGRFDTEPIFGAELYKTKN